MDYAFRGEMVYWTYSQKTNGNHWEKGKETAAEKQAGCEICGKRLGLLGGHSGKRAVLCGRCYDKAVAVAKTGGRAKAPKSWENGSPPLIGSRKQSPLMRRRTSI